MALQPAGDRSAERLTARLLQLGQKVVSIACLREGFAPGLVGIPENSQPVGDDSLYRKASGLLLDGCPVNLISPLAKAGLEALAERGETEVGSTFSNARGDKLLQDRQDRPAVEVLPPVHGTIRLQLAGGRTDEGRRGSRE